MHVKPAPCTGIRVVGCLLIAFSGFLLVASLIAEGSLSMMLSALALYTAGLSPVPLMLVSYRFILASLTLSLGAVAVLLYTTELWPLSTVLSMTAAGVAALDRWQASVPMLAAPIALAAALAPGDYKWLLISGYTVLLAAAASIYFKKKHAAALSAAAIVPLLSPGEPAILAALTATLVYLATTRTVEYVLCPFRVDSRSLFAGSVLAALGFALWIAGLELVGYPIALAGTIILVTANLAPYTATAEKLESG